MPALSQLMSEPQVPKQKACPRKRRAGQSADPAQSARSLQGKV